MTMKTVSVCALIAGVAGMACADLVDVTQIRTISALAESDASSDGPNTLSAEPFAAFNTFVTANISGGGSALGAIGSQNSAFEADRIRAQGNSTVGASGVGDIFARGESVLDITFGVDRATEVTVSSFLGGNATFSFTVIGGATLLEGDGDWTLTLDPGLRYRVFASAVSQRSLPGNSSSVFFVDVIGVPAPGAAGLLAAAGLMGSRRRR